MKLAIVECSCDRCGMDLAASRGPLGIGRKTRTGETGQQDHGPVPKAEF
jgi:hypothetical protein